MGKTTYLISSGKHGCQQEMSGIEMKQSIFHKGTVVFSIKPRDFFMLKTVRE
jgi:hypothetical protein